MTQKTTVTTDQFILAPVDALLQELEMFVRVSRAGRVHRQVFGAGEIFLLWIGSVVEDHQQSVLKQGPHAHVAFVQLHDSARNS